MQNLLVLIRCFQNAGDQSITSGSWATKYSRGSRTPLHNKMRRMRVKINPRNQSHTQHRNAWLQRKVPPAYCLTFHFALSKVSPRCDTSGNVTKSSSFSASLGASAMYNSSALTCTPSTARITNGRVDDRTASGGQPKNGVHCRVIKCNRLKQCLDKQHADARQVIPP